MTITIMYVKTYKNTLVNVRKPMRYECVSIRTWTDIGNKVELILLYSVFVAYTSAVALILKK